MNYKILEKKITKWQFTFTQVKREGDVAIYEQRKKDNDEFIAFEVIKISKHDGYEIAGNKVEAAEMYPSNELWGTYGFTYPNIESAKIKYEELKKKKFEDNKKISGVTNQFIMELPDKEFTIKDLAKEYGKSNSYIYNQLMKRDDWVISREIKGGRGKPTKVYKRK